MLFPHQHTAVKWLKARTRGYLGDLPGMGKTHTLAATVAALNEYAVVVCPAIVRSHWRRALAEHGAAGEVRSFDEIVRGEYELMRNLLAPNPGVLIVDEAHYCKHSQSRRAQMMLGANGYARRVEHVYAASGTPVPRHPGEFWTILVSMFPEVAIQHGLKNRAQFEARFCKTKGRLVRGVWREKVVGMQNDAEFQAILNEVMLRREAPEGTPEVWWQTLALDAADYIELDTPAPFTGDSGSMTWDEFKLTLASPEVATYRRKVGEAKVKPIVEQLASELANVSEKVVLFAHHRSVMHELAAGLKSFGVVQVHGDVSPLAREAALDAFHSSPDVRVFLGQNQACGTGMDGLQYTASRMLLVEPSWVKEENNQLAARLARMGQSANSVRAQMVCLAGTLDEWIVNQNKREAEMHIRMFPQKEVQ